MPTGRALVDEIDATTLRKGELAFWWLGQHGFVVKLGETVVYLDPFLSDLPGRTVPPVLAPGEITNAAVVTGSHDHADHIDRPAWPAIAAASPGAKFVVPDLARESVIEGTGLDPGRVLGLDDGTSVEIGEVSVTGVPAAHEMLDRDVETGRFPYLGFVVEGEGSCIYHTGDTCGYEGMESRLRDFPRFDVAFLPINGRDAERLRSGCIGNMTFQEAVDLAGATGPRLAVPAHFEMFAHNGEDPKRFADYLAVKYPDLRSHVPRHGERFLLAPA